MKPSHPSRRPYVVAVVLGSALSALGPASPAALASPDGAPAVSAMTRYCTACWRNARLAPDGWADWTQEVLCRLAERVRPERWDRVLGAEGDERTEFLRAIDTVKKRAQRSRRLGSGTLDWAADRREPGRRRQAEDRQALDQAAEQLLSPRQQRILQLSLDGWSIADIARSLDLPAARVSDEKYKAVRKLQSHFAA